MPEATQSCPLSHHWDSSLCRPRLLGAGARAGQLGWLGRKKVSCNKRGKLGGLECGEALTEVGERQGAQDRH